ncbi:MAG: response regulator [Acidobacteriota bacterium]|nr:response regulator [Acidobacteriota bacterium]MDQ7087270.1 response regulator [Acidobacteriota bacterium]
MHRLVAQHLADDLIDQSRGATLTQVGVAGLVSLLLWWEDPPGLVWWTVALAVLSAGRYLWMTLAPRPFPLEKLPMARVLVLGTGLIWSVGLATSMATVAPEPRSILVFVLVGMISGACQSLYFDPYSIGFYGVPMMASGVGVMFWVGTWSATMTAIMLIVYGVYIGVATYKRYLSTVDLIQSREIAIRSNEARRLFLANVSHEIRTPLGGIMGMTDLLLRTQLDAEQLEYAMTTRTCARSLAYVIDDILDYSKIEAGRMELRSDPFDLVPIVEQVMDILSQRAREAGLTLSCYIDPTLPRAVVGDAGRFRQILINLVNNGIKFTERGSVSIEVGGRRTDASRLELEVRVRDTGIGISLEDQQRIFDAFTQVDASEARRHGGSGLGLAISRRLVEMMGGKIGVESTPGRGSTFWFTAVLGCQQGDARLTDLLPPSMEGIGVLLVEGDGESRRVLSRQLRDAGLRVLVAADPGGVAAAVQAQDASIGLMVVVARGAMEEFHTLVADAVGAGVPAGIPALLIRPMGSRGDAESFRRMGFGNSLSLPVKPSWLLQAVACTFEGAVFSPVGGPQRRTSPNAAPAVRSGGQVRILLAEDNPVNRMVAVRILEELGYQVVTAENGFEALAALRSGDFDLLLSDVQMPEMDGIELTRRIRAGEQPGQRLPIVAMTAHAFEEDRRRCLDAGMDDYVCKPIAGEELDRVIRSQLVPRLAASDVPPR